MIIGDGEGDGVGAGGCIGVSRGDTGPGAAISELPGVVHDGAI